MAQRRRRHLRRDLLVFAGSVVVHIGLFFIAAAQFTVYNLPQSSETAVQVEIVPPTVEPIPPLPRVPKPTPAPSAQPPAPQPVPVQPTPQPQKPAPTPAPPQPVAAPTAPTQSVHAPIPAPAPKAAPAPSPLAPQAAAPKPGPLQAVPKPSVAAPETRSLAAPHIVLHKDRNQGAPLGPALNLPGATFAPSPEANGPSGGAPGGGRAGGGGASGVLPGGVLPGFGRGLRGGVLGCANAAALHLSAAEQARCDESFGEGALQSPKMDAIDASKRGEFDREAAAEEAARKYRDSTPGGSGVTPTPGQPKILQSPAQ